MFSPDLMSELSEQSSDLLPSSSMAAAAAALITAAAAALSFPAKERRSPFLDPYDGRRDVVF
jgi:hypothetical protein